MNYLEDHNILNEKRITGKLDHIEFDWPILDVLKTAYYNSSYIA